MTNRFFVRLSLALILGASGVPLFAQKKKTSPPVVPSIPKPFVSSDQLQSLKWRNIGPFRAGRSLACAGHGDFPLTYYFGATGGGVWKTNDGGANWFSISDSTFKSSSVGAIAVAPSDANVVYVGMGEADMRSNISFGDGIYKSTDGGATWKHIGLKAVDAIATIEVHPKDANVVYVAAVGDPFAPNKERGVYRSLDGGATWKQILAKNDSTGAYHVRIDPNNPRIIYATLWQAYRNGHSMSSGGKGCGIYKSMDGGDTWVCLNEKPGMPKGLLGKIGIAVSSANSNRLYAMIESAKGGLYRSDDGGEHWQLINEDKNLWQRPWYYMNLQTLPNNENGLIVLNVNSFKSLDGGKTFTRINVHHGDTHDVWVNPKNADNFIISDDGGAEVTYNGGVTFSEVDIPTAQFYHVSVDNDFPYNVYGAQQDNSSIRIASRTDDFSIGSGAWYPVAGGESGYIVSDPNNPKITFGGSYDGLITKHNAETNQDQDISFYPERFMGNTSANRKYRFQWTYPIMFSPHDSKRMFITSQYVHTSTDYGMSWETISPDLTRNDPKTTGPTGGPITLDQTGAETYATIFALAESPLEKGVYYTGSDDGYVYVSKDAGKNWENITLPTTQLGDLALISIIHCSDFVKGKVYLSATRYMFGDRKPYAFVSTDYGKTWKSITNGIPADEYVRVVREDPNKQGLLYMGTERGIYVSFDDGATWQSLNLNLPSTPIRDLQVQKREKDLVVSTHGRSFWILDDITPLYELADNALENKKIHLFKPRHAYRMQGGQGGFRGAPLDAGTNAPNGVIINYYLREKPAKEFKMKFFTAANEEIITYSNQKDRKGEPIRTSKDFYEDVKMQRPGILSAKTGLNTFLWDMRYPDAEQVEGPNFMWSGSVTGPKAIPGNYTVKLYLGDSLVAQQPFEILQDPRLKLTTADYQAQLELLLKINKKLSETHSAINQIKKIKKQINDYMGGVKEPENVKKFENITKPMLKQLDEIEGQLMQPKARAPQDLLAHPIQLNDKLAGVGSVVGSADSHPTKQSYDAYNDLSQKIDAQINKLKSIVDKDVPAFNNMVSEQRIPAINLTDKKKDSSL
ncbi:MAG: glycosyl hydrolase [Spirosomataceae bacterium]